LNAEYERVAGAHADSGSPRSFENEMNGHCTSPDEWSFGDHTQERKSTGITPPTRAIAVTRRVCDRTADPYEAF
jgi:hypothetical protein